MSHFDMSYLGVMVDIAGCPNHCRHCWLGAHKNGHMSIDEFKYIAAQFKHWRDEDDRGIAEMGFFSWWREPDYRDDYRELWQLEQELSSPGRAERFELLSTWRLANDESYATWVASLVPKKCQITFFGMEGNTDWGMRRKGAFKDQLKATERLLAVGISPRWQLFITKRCLNELDEFLHLIYDMKLFERCENIVQKFEVFIGGISPEGCGYEIEDFRVEEDDLNRIPQEFISICREGTNMLGQPEYKLLDYLIIENQSANFLANFPCIAIDADYDVYPNIAEPAEWWKLGNLKTDGIDSILKAYRDETTPGMIANRTIPIAELARRYGQKNSKKLYDKSDLICRFMHQWGEDWMMNNI
ncbi:MAG: radical SAM protein [Parabacteroides sp.]|nr:radical SAM protein [Parabacteroides sp.]